MTDDYREILREADDHFRRILAEQPSCLSCRVGCSACCVGLFEIAAADVAVIVDAVRRLPADQRAALVSKAEAIAEESGHPDLRSLGATEKEAFFDRVADTPCPALDADGACSIYDARPIVCRTFGLPIREGTKYLGQECELNFAGSTHEEKERAAWDLLREDAVDPDEQYTVVEAILLARKRRV